MREARRVLGGSNQKFLLLAKFLGLAVSNQGIGNVPEGPLNRLFIAEQELLLPRFGQADVRSQPPAVKIGWVSVPPKFHNPAGPVNKLVSAEL